MIVLEGLESLETELNNIENCDFTTSLRKGAILVENAAKRKAPVDTGALRRSITHEVEKNRAEVGTNVEWAPYVEFGTGLFAVEGNGRDTPWTYQDEEGDWYTTEGQEPQPFLYPALDENEDAVVEYIEQQIEKELKGHGRLQATFDFDTF